MLVGWAKEKEAIAVDVHKLILKFSDLSGIPLDSQISLWLCQNLWKITISSGIYPFKFSIADFP